MAGPTGWTTERTETLKQLWAKGLSAGQAAQRMGVTRNTVIGKLYRLGLCKRMDPRAATSSQRNAGKKRAKVFAARKQRRSASVFVAEALPLPREDAPTGPLVMFADLEAHHCRAPYGDPKQPGFGFCGCKVVPGLSYCETHVRRFYTAPNLPERRGAPLKLPVQALASLVSPQELEDVLA